MSIRILAVPVLGIAVAACTHPAPPPASAATERIAARPSDPAVPPAAPTGLPAAQGEQERDVADAVAVVRGYYDAINQHAYDRAFALWAGAGAASNQTFRQFAHGFADTRSVQLEVGTPSGIDAGAGQRYIDIPVRIAATHVDGTVHGYAGSYTLHRAVVDGATAEQRAWRIGSAKLREAPVRARSGS